ncbi:MULTISPECIES: MDR family MFS transporter [Arthrobacter]|nr:MULTISPECIES: MDR family MFS transporter [Arthrobacter]MBT8161860.1 MFS transporter [Arthrobacter sp. GN70]
MKAEQDPMPARLSPRQIVTAMSGLIIAMLLAQLDNMIVAPALPTIVGELGGMDHLAWVTTGYVLASTVATPIWGKLGDIFGHRRTFMTSIAVFLLGSALCGMSQDMAQLIGFRAFQGLGAGGLMVGIMAAIGLMVPPRERGKYQGIMMAVMPLAMIGGPLLGGFITDNASWRWAFYVNLPLGILSLVVCWFTLKLPKQNRTEKVRIDWWGSAVLTVWITALVLMLSWGGSQYDWNSPEIIGLGAIAAVGLIVFLVIENKAAEPVIPLRLFNSSNFSLANALGFIVGFAMFGGITFLPQFQQYVQGQSATNSGLLLMPMMIAAMVVSLSGGLVITRTGHYKSLPVIGSALMAVGLYLFSTMGLDTPAWQSGVYMAVLGAGMGCMMQTTNLIAQNSVQITDIGAATGTSTFARNMGGSLGISVLGSIYANRLTDTMGNGGGGGLHQSGQITPAALHQLPQAIQDLFKTAVTNGIQSVFLWAAIVAAVGFVLAMFIRHVPLRGHAPTPTAAAEATAEELAF